MNHIIWSIYDMAHTIRPYHVVHTISYAPYGRYYRPISHCAYNMRHIGSHESHHIVYNHCFAPLNVKRAGTPLSTSVFDPIYGIIPFIIWSMHIIRSISYAAYDMLFIKFKMLDDPFLKVLFSMNSLNRLIYFAILTILSILTFN